MLYKNNDQGSSIVTVLLLLVVVGLIGAVGWLVYGKQNSTKILKSDTAATKLDSTQNSEVATSKNEYYELMLPKGWKLTSEKPNGVSYDDAFMYADETGKRLTVYVNIGNVGGAGDASIEYMVVDDRIHVDIDAVTLQKYSNDGGPCSVGDGKLRVMASSGSQIKSNNYLFDYVDNNTESTQSLVSLKSLIESMKF